MRKSARPVLTIALGLVAAALAAQPLPFFTEFRANSYTTGFQHQAAIASEANGSFVVVWTSYGQDGSGGGTFAQRFDAYGMKDGTEFRANTSTTGDQDQPAAAALGEGRFVIVWRNSSGLDGSDDGVFGQRFDGGGAKLGPEFRVNTTTTDDQNSPAVAADGEGGFLVVWSSEFGDGSASGIFAQRFNSSGGKVGSEFRVNTQTTGSQSSPKVGADGTGNFVVVWNGGNSQDGSDFGVFGQRLDDSDSKVGTEFQVNTYTTGPQTDPSLAVGPAGTFVVVWSSDGQDGAGGGIFGQRFNGEGARIGVEFPVNTYTLGNQWSSSVAVGNAGDFVVAWQSNFQDGDLGGIFGQRFDRRAEKVGSEFPINTATTNFQETPRIVHDGFGYVVFWQSLAGAADILGRRQNLSPAALAVDAQPGMDTISDVNGVLEPGEKAVVAPAWTNRNSFFASLNTTLTAFTGPSGGIYLINDGSANYDETAPNTVTDCHVGALDDCYVVSVAGARPQTHWDATARENVGPSGAQFWNLHIGDSFTDVPRTQPFYAKIEAIFHHGISSGCGPAQFCPSTAVSRDQMAIFIAKGIAVLGENVPSTGTAFSASYDCSPGGNSLFTDVPPTADYCRHVHFLAAQNVTLGCDVAAFCPAQSTTREEMASFIAKGIVAPGGGGAVPLSYTDPATMLSYSCDSAAPNLHFTDVPASNQFCKHIHFLWAKGIVSGCSPTQYCPGQPVQRDAMAKFLANGFTLELYGP